MAKGKSSGGREFGMIGLLIAASYVLAFLTSYYFLVPNISWLQLKPSTLGLHALTFMALCYLVGKSPTWSNVFAAFSLLDTLILGWILRSDWIGLVVGLVVWLLLLAPYVVFKVIKIGPSQKPKVVNNTEKSTIKTPRDTVGARIGVAGVDPNGVPGENVTDVTDLLATGQAGQRLKQTDQEIELRKLEIEEARERRLRDEHTAVQNTARVERLFALYQKGPEHGITRERLNQMLIQLGEEPLDVPAPEPELNEDGSPKDRSFSSNAPRRSRTSTVVEPWGAALLHKIFKREKGA